MQVKSAMTTKRMTAYFIFAVDVVCDFAGNRKDLVSLRGKELLGSHNVTIAGLEQY
jgi:hypothetical protein